MKEIERKPAETPSCLLELEKEDGRKKDSLLITKQEKYTKSWIASVNKHRNGEISSPSFDWHDLRDDLMGLLLEMTKNHCSFCDKYFDYDAKEIEHFQPKVKFPENSFEWSNLFVSCHLCNKAKGEKFDELLLKSDDSSYKFYNNFRYNFKSGELEPKNDRAEKTIEIYDLNNSELTKSRKKWINEIKEKLENKIAVNLDECSYRFIIEILLSEDVM